MSSNFHLSLFNTALYIRLSREDGDKEESDSVGNQRSLLTEYALSKGEFSLYQTYVDDGYTGTNFNRPAFQHMMADIEDGKVNCVIVKDLSRFGRDYIDTGQYLERRFPALGVRFISISDNIDSIRQSYDLLLPIKNIFNEQYARDISAKIHTTMKSKQKAGEFIGAFSSYGYKKSPLNKNNLITDPYAAEIVRSIFSMFTQGFGKQQIANHLNREGILCPAEYKRVNGENYKNGNHQDGSALWSYSTINSILHKEIYIGNMVQGTKMQTMRSPQKKIAQENWIIVEHTHDPIIDMNTWKLTKNLLHKRTRSPALAPAPNIFSGFIRCGDCGKTMVKNSWKKADGSKSSTFYCGTYKRNGKDFCSPHALPQKILEEIIHEDLNKILQNSGDISKFIQKVILSTTECIPNSSHEMEKIKNNLDRIRKLKKSVYEDYKDELITKEEFLSYHKDYLKKESLYQRQIETLSNNNTETSVNQTEFTSWSTYLTHNNDVLSLNREVITELIDQILVYEGHKIKIIYNFSNEANIIF
jgi:site-specific DNA recombinase